MKNLPEEFTEKMRGLLGSEADAFFESFEEERRFGLRVNPLKTEGEVPEYLKGLKKIPWSEEGFYYEDTLRPGKHPFHDAGLYYIQEPSAQACAEVLAPAPGERILDLCAAPGGKTTHLAGKMRQQGLLVSNEIHPARAKILSQNVERMGIGNAVVTNMEPAGLAAAFPEFFDGIIVDAPCSGEGMFRKDEDARAEWSPDHVAMCAKRQDGILDCAASMVRPGGRIVYSTCTFSPEENEQTAVRFLGRHPEFTLVRPALSGFFSEGRPEWAGGEEEVRKTIRIWPHKAEGEGHFIALFVRKIEGEEAETGLERTAVLGAEAGPERTTALEAKTGPERTEALGAENGPKSVTALESQGLQKQSSAWNKESNSETNGKNRKKKGDKKAGQGEKTLELKDFFDFCQETIRDTSRMTAGRKFLAFGDNLYLVPEEMKELTGLKVLRPGLHLGTFKKGRFEPSHALALFLKSEEVFRAAEAATREAAEKYQRGETLEIPDHADWKGWTLVTLSGFPLGFAKADRGVLKNHYPKGLRRY